MSEITDEFIADAKERMAKSVESCKHELATVRTGRASPHLLDRIVVDYYGANTPLKQLGTINAPEPRLLTIQVWDRSAIRAIEKAIQSSDLGLNPAIDGQLIRLPIPALTEQRRKDMVKLVHGKAEEARIAVRNVRRHVQDSLRKAEKDGGVSQDELKRHEDELQKLTDAHIQTIDNEAKRKETELLEA